MTHRLEAEAGRVREAGPAPIAIIGDRQLAILPAFLPGCGGASAEAGGSVGPEQGDVGVTNDPHRRSIRDQEAHAPHRQARHGHGDQAAIGEPLLRGRAQERCGR